MRVLRELKVPWRLRRYHATMQHGITGGGLSYEYGC
jgi:hypothetical protein